MTDKMIVACPECRTRFVAPLEKFLPDGRKVRCAKCGHAWFQRVGEEPEAAAPPKTKTAAPTETAPEAVHDPTPETVAQAEPTKDLAEEAKPARTRSAIEEGVARTEAARAAALAAGGTAVAAGSAYAAKASSSYGSAETARMPDLAPPELPARKRSWWRSIFYCLAALIVLGALAYFYRAALSERFPVLAAPLASFSERVDRVVGSVAPAFRALKIENVKYDFEPVDGGRVMLLTAEVANGGADAVDAPTLTMKIIGANGAVLREAAVPPKEAGATIAPNARGSYSQRIENPPEDIDRVEVDFR